MKTIAAKFLFVVLAFQLGSPLVAQDKTMLYFFTSKGCAPCIQVKHVIRQLDSEGYPVTTIDVEDRPDWADAFRVSRTPTLALVRNNNVVAYEPGSMRAEELRNWFRSIRFEPLPNRQDSSPVRRSIATESKSGPSARVRPTQTKVSVGSGTSANKTNATFASATLHKGTRRPANRIESNALNATVRLRVEDEGGISFATGTVIHCHAGESLVLTCGHVFRESKGHGTITAEFGFEEGTPVRVPGQLLDYDSDANDIALVAIQNGSHALVAVDVAAASSDVDRGDRVFSLGCDHGDSPTIRNTAIKNLARYDGSLKYDIYGRPVNGRSGGGLFNEEGKLIGVCNAAAVEVDEGIYTALETVHWQLAKTNLDHLFDNQVRPASPVQTRPSRSAIAANAGNRSSRTNQKRMVPIQRGRSNVNPAVLSGRDVASQIQNVGFEQRIESSSDYEVIIKVQSKSNPSDSRTIRIADPTPKLLDYLESMDRAEPRAVKMANYRMYR